MLINSVWDYSMMNIYHVMDDICYSSSVSIPLSELISYVINVKFHFNISEWSFDISISC